MTDCDPDAIERSVFVRAQHEAAPGGLGPLFRRARLLYVEQGVMTIRSATSLSVVPSGHAAWLMPGVSYQTSMAQVARLVTLYVDSEFAPMSARDCVVVVERLVAELLMAAAQFTLDYGPDGREARLTRVLLDRLETLAVAPLTLGLPRDPRIQRIADALSANPAAPAVLDELAAGAGVTTRTAARLFIRDTGRTFGQWRQHFRVLLALEGLGRGASVNQVALAVGYSDVSSFIAVFKDALGATPARYFRQL